MSILNKSSGINSINTNGDDSVEILVAQTPVVNTMTIFNTGTVAGFYSIDGGVVWHYLPAAAVISQTDLQISVAILIKRKAGGSNVTGVYISAGTL